MQHWGKVGDEPTKIKRRCTKVGETPEERRLKTEDAREIGLVPKALRNSLAHSSTTHNFPSRFAAEGAMIVYVHKIEPGVDVFARFAELAQHPGEFS